MAPPRVWVVPSLARVGADDAPATTMSAEVFAARGETRSFQVVVQAPATGLKGLNLSRAPFTSASGGKIPVSCATLYRGHFVNVPIPCPSGSLGPGWYADALIPFLDPDTGLTPIGPGLDIRAVPFDVPPGQWSRNTVFWVDVAVPRDAAPGVYTAILLVFCDLGTVPVPITLTVWNFTLPVKPSLYSAFLVDGPPSLPIAKELLRNRLMPVPVTPSSERALIDGLGLASVDLGLWSGADAGATTMPAPPPPATVQGALAVHQADLLHYAYTADEITPSAAMIESIKAWSRALHKAGANQLITTPPLPALYDDGTGVAAVDIWVVLPKQYDSTGTQEAKTRGTMVWSYNTLSQDDYSPKWLINSLPIGFRLQPGLLSQSLGLSGILYWRVNRYTSDPWHDVVTDHEGGVGFAGEGMLVYPGANVGTLAPAPSMRLKWLRDGVNDFEYVQMLKRAGWGDGAVKLSRSIAADFKNWTKDPAALESARIKMGRVLDAIT